MTSAKHMQHTAHMGRGYTQIWSLIGFAHGQICIGSETHSYSAYSKQLASVKQSAELCQIFQNTIHEYTTSHEKQLTLIVLHDGLNKIRRLEI